MLKNFKYNRWLLACIVLGLAAALMVSFQRHRTEQDSRTAEMTIDYEGLVELAEIEGVPVSDVLKQAKAAGITSLAVYETTLKKLDASGKVSVIPGSELLKSYHSGSMSDPAWRALVERGGVRGEDVYITQHDSVAFAEMKLDLVRRLGADRVVSLDFGGKEALAIKANFEKVVKWNLGLPVEELKLVNAAGFDVVARPSNYLQVTEDDIASVFARLEGIRVSDVVFSGDEILGYPDKLGVTARYMNARDLTFGMIEHPLQLQFFKQEGLVDLARLLDFRAARLYTIPKDEQPKMKIDAAIERWTMTDQERNIRINLLRTYEKPEGNMTLLDTNMKYFSEVKKGLEDTGFAIGKAGTFAPYYPPRFALVLMTIGATAAGVLYLSLVFPFRERYQNLLLALLAAVLCAPILMGSGATVRTAVALASANLFPALAVIWQLDNVRKYAFSPKTPLYTMLAVGVGALLATGALSFIGGAYLGGVLADVEYFLEVNIFRGVKLTFVLPIILVSIAFLARFNLFDGAPDDTAGIVKQIKRILNTPVYLKSLALLGFAAVAAIVFVGRSGHTAGIPVPGIELKFRAFLEEAMYARPRSKELLIGHPAFLLAVTALYKKWPSFLFFVLVICATIGQGSLVETFAHIRTPIYMSFMRGVGGLVLGAGLGAILMALAHFVFRWSSFAGRSSAKHE